MSACVYVCVFVCVDEGATMFTTQSNGSESNVTSSDYEEHVKRMLIEVM